MSTRNPSFVTYLWDDPRTFNYWEPGLIHSCRLHMVSGKNSAVTAEQWRQKYYFVLATILTLLLLIKLRKLLLSEAFSQRNFTKWCLRLRHYPNLIVRAYDAPPGEGNNLSTFPRQNNMLLQH